MQHSDADDFLTTAMLRGRYKKCSKTIERWVATGVLPEPQIINGRKHWRRGALEQREREGMGPRKRDSVAAS
jgi:hypothetical protein